MLAIAFGVCLGLVLFAALPSLLAILCVVIRFTFLVLFSPLFIIKAAFDSPKVVAHVPEQAQQPKLTAEAVIEMLSARS